MTANQQKAYLKRVAREEEESVFRGCEVYATKHKEPSTNSKKKSCINFAKSIKNNFNVMHNDRSLRAEHIKDGEFEVNRTADEAIELKEQMIRQAIEAYEANKSKRAPKFRAKDYEHSAVALIKPDTTMQDLEVVAKHFESKYGFQCYQIAIHRDEGHYPKNVKGDPTPLEINHHAHFEFITLDKNTGKNRWREVNKKVMSDFQTEVAEILQMERGIDKRITGAYHLNHYQYRYKAQAQELERLELEQHIKQEQENQKEPQKPQIKLTSDKSEIIYLNVPYNEKDEAKGLGAKWDKDKKQWYIPQVDSTPFAKWLPQNFKTKSQEIAELHEKATEQDEALVSMRAERNSAQISLEKAQKEIVSLKAIKADFEALRKEMIEWGYCDKDDYKIRTDLLKQTLENAKNNKQFTQDDLSTAITEAKQEIQERHKTEIEALKSTNEALEAKISDLESKQWVGITQDDLNDLRANYGTEKEFFQALSRKFQSEFIEIVKILCDGDEVKAQQIRNFEILKPIIIELVEFKKAHQELQQEPRQVQIQAKAKSKKDDFER
ncbi:DUF5710 domain-containing protein [Helicobacter canis]|uniref:Mobilization protein n=1 Tax=Helicobacter canis TaxID=29419 RepID=A0A377J3M7_9HELI|nr:DUF5710 domain-containing protein [Helicobacter canis]STO96905.1 mobilization protein [Helicobacter canis]